MYPRYWKEVAHDAAECGYRDPSATVLDAAKIRMDVAAMLYHRAWFSNSGGVTRFGFADASPQRRQGVEVFCSGELVVRCISHEGCCLAEIMNEELHW